MALARSCLIGGPNSLGGTFNTVWTGLSVPRSSTTTVRWLGVVDRCSGCSSAALTGSVGGRPEQALAEGPSRLSDTAAVAVVVVTGVSVSTVRWRGGGLSHFSRTCLKCKLIKSRWDKMQQHYFPFKLAAIWILRAHVYSATTQIINWTWHVQPKLCDFPLYFFYFIDVTVCTFIIIVMIITKRDFFFVPDCSRGGTNAR